MKLQRENISIKTWMEKKDFIYRVTLRLHRITLELHRLKFAISQLSYLKIYISRTFIFTIYKLHEDINCSFITSAE